MKIIIIEKQKNRIYKSEKIVKDVLGKELVHDESGAPAVEGAFISVSDTKNYWGCAVSDEPVGFDIEESSRTVKPQVASRLHKTEQDYLSPLSPGSSEWKDEFLRIWVRKEAYMKLCGKGLRMGLSSFSVIDSDTSEALIYKKLYLGIAEKKSPESKHTKSDAPDSKHIRSDAPESKHLESHFLQACITEPDYDAPFEKSALEAAADFLDYSGYSSAELKKKLKAKGYSDADAEESVQKLSAAGYINDEAFARNAAEKLASSGKAPRRIEQELIKKGIPAEIARSVSSEFGEDLYEKALALASKYSVQSEKDLAKIGRKLSSLGYEPSIIYDILNRLRNK